MFPRIYVLTLKLLQVVKLKVPNTNEINSLSLFHTVWCQLATLQYSNLYTLSLLYLFIVNIYQNLSMEWGWDRPPHRQTINQGAGLANLPPASLITFLDLLLSALREFFLWQRWNDNYAPECLGSRSIWVEYIKSAWCRTIVVVSLCFAFAFYK